VDNGSGREVKVHFMSRHPNLIVYLALLAASVVAFLWPLLVQPDSLCYPTYAPYSDLATIHWPKATLQAQSIRDHGQWPLWTPRILSGMPLAANPLAMSFYPPTLLFLVLPVGVAFNLLWAFHFWLAGAGTYLWLRRAVGVSAPAAMLGALACAFAGKMAAHMAAGHVSLVGAVAWLPWALYFVDRAVTQKSLRGALLAGAALALQATTHSQIFLHTAYLVLAYGLVAAVAFALTMGKDLVVSRPDDRQPGPSLSLGRRLADLQSAEAVSRLGALALAFVVAGLLAAVQLWPLVEMAPYSNRALSTGEASAHALTPLTLLVGLLLPTGQGGHEPVIYLGLTPLLLFPFAWARRRDWRIVFCAALALFALLFALGDATPLYGLLRRLPGLGYTRTPARVGFLLALAGATLAAAGFDALISGIWTGVVHRRWRLAALSIAVTGLAAGSGLAFVAGVSRATWGLALLPVLIVGSISAGRRSKSHRQWILAAGLGALLLADLWSFGWTLWRAVPPEEAFVPGAEAAAWLAAQPGWFRVYSPGYAVEQQVAAEHHLELADGVEPVHLAAYDRYASVATGVPITGFSVTVPPFSDEENLALAHRDAVPNLKLLGLLNVRYLVAAFDVRGEELIERARFGEIRILENPWAMPRAFVVGQVEPVRDEAEALARLCGSPASCGLVVIDPRQIALVEEGPPLTSSTTFQEASVVHYSPNRIEVDVNLDAPGFLVLSEAWYPGWQAVVNDEPVRLYRTDSLLRGVYLERGMHQVVFTYRPLSVRVGRTVSGLSGLTLAGYLAWAVLRARRQVA
jgi:hypothetical protein